MVADAQQNPSASRRWPALRYVFAPDEMADSLKVNRAAAGKARTLAFALRGGVHDNEAGDSRILCYTLTRNEYGTE